MCPQVIRPDATSIFFWLSIIYRLRTSSRLTTFGASPIHRLLLPSGRSSIGVPLSLCVQRIVIRISPQNFLQRKTEHPDTFITNITRTPRRLTPRWSQPPLPLQFWTRQVIRSLTAYPRQLPAAAAQLWIVSRNRMMNPILATGGLDDVALALGEFIILSVLFVAAGLIVLSWWKRSLVAGLIASFLISAAAAFFQPWTVIRTDEGYDAYWLFRLRVVSVIWLLLVLAAAACLFRVIRHRRSANKTLQATAAAPGS